MRIEVRLAGAGGQGLILAGIILAETCGVYEGKYVVQTQNYGPEARGGSSRSDVIISSLPILFPKARDIDLLACLSQEAYDDYHKEVSEDGLILLDSFYVRRFEMNKRVKGLPFSQTARERFGQELFANVILLGALSKIFSSEYHIAQIDFLKMAVGKRVPPHHLKTNLTALEIGYEMVT